MKALLPILLFAFFSFGQTTAIPDQNFEQALIDLGHDDVIDGQVLTSNISFLTSLDVVNKGITDLTGIEDFSSLVVLNCHYNMIQILDVSQNLALEELSCGGSNMTSLNVAGASSLRVLSCGGNELTSLDVSQNLNLYNLDCQANLLTSLDVSQNSALVYLTCSNNQLTSLNLPTSSMLHSLWCDYNNLTMLDLNNQTSLVRLEIGWNDLTSIDLNNNQALTYFTCPRNQITALSLTNNSQLTRVKCGWNNLECMNIKNGNNTNIDFIDFNTENNPNLFCIEVDNAGWSGVNWPYIDAQTSFSTNCDNLCSSLSIEEISHSSKELVKIVDFLGREVHSESNRVLIYIYSDGSIEKKFVLE